MTTCTNHRVQMVSSELVYATKFCYGDPIAQRVTYRCATCQSQHVIEFPEQPKTKSNSK